jgi:phosphopantothenoylcysteine decarboxylase/phosphopantothenate--cysteine ligase
MKNHPRTLITAGPTHEPIDRVRYIGNRSSGQMGIALAEAALARQLPTTLLLGPVEADRMPVYSGLTLFRFRTSADLETLLRTHWPHHDLLLMAAAVADYRPRTLPGPEKIRRGDAPLNLTLDPVPDLLAACATTSRPDQVLIGFGLEPEQRLFANALSKLTRKGIDAIVANPLETIGSETIRPVLVSAGGIQEQPGDGVAPLSKREFAAWLIERSLALWRSKNSP